MQFDKALKKNPSKGLNTPFRFDILAQLVNIPACITLHELLRLSKETRLALRDALVDKVFWHKYHPSLLTKVGLYGPIVIWHHTRCQTSLSPLLWVIS